MEFLIPTPQPWCWYLRLLSLETRKNKNKPQSRPSSATGAGGFEVLIANCKLQKFFSFFSLFFLSFFLLRAIEKMPVFLDGGIVACQHDFSRRYERILHEVSPEKRRPRRDEKS